MLVLRDKGILLHIIAHCKRIEEKIKYVKTVEEFNMNEDVKEIVCFNIMQIGELAKKLSDDFIKQNGDIPWKKIKGMREHVVHGYGTIDLNIVWFTATNDIASLRDCCEKIIAENN